MNEIIDFSHTDPTTSTIYSTRPGPYHRIGRHLIADHRHSQSAARVIVADDDDDVVTSIASVGCYSFSRVNGNHVLCVIRSVTSTPAV